MKLKYGFLCEAFSILLALPASVIINRALGPESRGILGIVLLLPSMASTIASLQWDRNVRAGVASARIEYDYALRKTVKLLPIMTAIGFILVAISVFFVPSLPIEYKYLSILSSLILVPLPVYGAVSQAILIAKAQTSAFYEAKIYAQILYLTTVIILFASGFLNVIGGAISIIIFWCGTVVLLSKKINALGCNIDSVSGKSTQFLDVGVLTNIIEVIALQSPMLIAAQFCGVEIAGVYAAFKIFELPVQTLAAAIANVTYADLIKLKNYNLYIIKYSGMVIVAGLLCYGLVRIFGADLIRVFLGNAYNPFSEYADLFVLSSVAIGLGAIASNFMQVNNGNRVFYLVQGADCALKTLILVGSSYKFGTAGFFYGYALSNIVRFVMSYFYIIKERS